MDEEESESTQVNKRVHNITDLSKRQKCRRVANLTRDIFYQFCSSEQNYTLHTPSSDITAVTNSSVNELPCDISNTNNELDCSTLMSNSSSDLTDLSDNECSTPLSPPPVVSYELAKWAKEFNIPNVATTSLLHILKHEIPGLPLDARTLLKTARTIDVKSCCGGSFIYFGVENNILNKAKSGLQTENDFSIIDQIKTKLNTDDIFTICVNVDGLPLSKSSNKSFWPVLGILNQAKDKSPFVIALYHGESKPSNSNDFLKPFVEECKNLESNGLLFNDKKYSFRISYLIADAPARAFLKCIVSFNSLHGCEKCTQEGEYYGRTTWKYIQPSNRSPPLRTDSEFKRMMYEDEGHQVCQSVISTLDVGLVSQVPIDYMHLICLGVVKRLIRVWVDKGPKNCRLNTIKVKQISDRLISATHYTPSEISRKPRELKLFKFWKATEFRAFVLYFGPVVLKGILHDHLYDHFLILHVAVYILASANLSSQTQLRDYANQLCHTFVRYIEIFYGKELMLYNFHNLLHITNDVANFGPLDCYSAFPFENFMKTLKSMVRGPNNPLQQVAKRLSETDFHISMQLSQVVNNDSFFNGKCKYVLYKGFKIGLEIPDCCFITKNGSVVLVNKIEKAKDSGEYDLTCDCFSSKLDYYERPIRSSSFGIFRVKKNSLVHVGTVSTAELTTKCVLITDFTDERSFICVPFSNMKCFY